MEKSSKSPSAEATAPSKPEPPRTPAEATAPAKPGPPPTPDKVDKVDKVLESLDKTVTDLVGETRMREIVTDLVGDAEVGKTVIALVGDAEVGKTVIALVGDAGVGKTRIAREIYKKISFGGIPSFGSTLWLSLNKKQDGDDDQMIRSLNEDLARQLSILPSTEGGFEDDDLESNEDRIGEKEKEKENEEMIHNLEEKLKAMTTVNGNQTRFVLLILDGAPENLNIQEAIISKLVCLKNLKEELLKVLITRRGSPRNEPNDHVDFPIETLKKEEFLLLLGKSAKTKDSVKDDEKEQFKKTIFTDAQKELRLPAAVAVLVGKWFKYSNIESLTNALKKAAEFQKAEEITRSLVASIFDTLPRNDEALIKCCWHSKKYFHSINNCSVHYNELIAHWIMEDYLDCSNSIEKAYEEGYRIMKELVNRSLLKVEDGDFIRMEEVAFEVADLRRLGFDETAMLGLPDVFARGREDQAWRGGLGKIAVADGMIKTMCGHNKWRMVSTLFIHGNRLSREVPETFFKPMKELQTLVLLDPRLKSLEFIRSSKLFKLRMLVLRGCDVLEIAIDSIKELELLTVLEISGAKSLKELPDDLFANMSELRSLNLTGIQVEHLPKSFTNLTKLRWLILRGCSRLLEIPNLKKFEGLQVLDMAGVSSLKVFKDKNFGLLKSLRALDFSEAKIAPLPFLHNLDALTRVTLKGCTEITRVPKLDKLSNLQILEIPGAENLREFYEPSLLNKPVLRILDLSGTKIPRLPLSFNNLPRLEDLNLSSMSCLEDLNNVSFSELASLQKLNLSNTQVKNLPSLANLNRLRELLLMDCPKLEKLPEMEGLSSLEILDLSRAKALKEIPDQLSQSTKLRQLLLPDCESLEKLPVLKDLTNLEDLNLSGCEAFKEIENQSFESMTCLQKLNLSGTQIESLPALPSHSNLSQLLLENCTKLQKLPSLSSLSNLEELNLCGANLSQQKPEAESLKHMSKLHTLNLTGTSIVLSSDFTDCTNLKKLSLGSCFFKDTQPKFEKLTLLEVLDLSDTAVRDDKSNNRLKVEGLKIQNLSRLTNLDLWEMTVEQFPYWISQLINLKKLRLPKLTAVKELDWGKIKRLPDALNWEDCGIFDISGTSNPESTPSISVNGTSIFKFSKSNSDNWNRCFNKFRIFLCPSTKNGKDEDIYRLRENSVFENIYFKTISCPESSRRFLEIRGFENRPDGLEDALKEVDCVSFIEDDFITCLADLGVDNIEAVTSLWFERCSKTRFIFSEEKAIKLGDSFNLLWVSNLPILESLYDKKVQDQCFKNLTEVYLDCCPMLKYVFLYPQVPENLKKLQVKFCDKLENLFKYESSRESHPQDQCLKNLTQVYLHGCPMLKYVFLYPQVPENLEKLQVKFCDKLETLFKCESSEKSSEEHRLLKLHELDLLELPELTACGVKLPRLQELKVKGCPNLEKDSFIKSLGLEKEHKFIE